MAKKNIRIRAKMKDDVAEVKALMSHPMETGLRTNKKTGKKFLLTLLKKWFVNIKGTRSWLPPGVLPYLKTHTCHSSSKVPPRVTPLKLAGMTIRAKAQLLKLQSANK